MHKPKRSDRMNREAKELTSEELREILGGQIIDKYNQTAKGIIDSMR
jgi:hypothetical protein